MKGGTLVGTDKFGNEYYENNDYIIIGSVVVLGVNLSDAQLTPSHKCTICRNFAEALYYAIDRNTHSSEMQTVTVSRCQVLLRRNEQPDDDPIDLAAYCSPFKATYFNALLDDAQEGRSTTYMCKFLCSGLVSQQSYRWQQNAQEYENPLTGAAYRESSEKQPGYKCDMCRDIAGKLITMVQSFHGNTYVS
ncbi:hypothetical protein GBAR_LOCUS31134 [Geodia barretti]|uniref:Uncharacterized protein n=1 Tax=Geodia barretti TaxID=519541 RepID=A0AA35U0V2_GEOBA|nr:hypothetical protein GBAR_LOCUS31134 [Geodia barretti]